MRIATETVLMGGVTVLECLMFMFFFIKKGSNIILCVRVIPIRVRVFLKREIKGRYWNIGMP